MIARLGVRVSLPTTPEIRYGMLIVLTVVVASFLVPILSPFDVGRGTGTAPLQPPSGQHLFGTDHLGRDVFVRTFAATRLDLVLALVAVTPPFIVGTILGAALGTTRSRLGQYLGDLVIESVNAFPTLIIIIGIVAAFGMGARGILIGLFLTAWARYAKVARGRAMTLREMDYLEAARCLGYSRTRRLLFHVAPNVFPVTLSYAIADFVVVILAIAGLSFLGAGIQPPEAEWGAMMSEGRLYFSRAPWPVLFPGALLTLTAVGIGLIAEGTDRSMRRSPVARVGKGVDGSA